MNRFVNSYLPAIHWTIVVVALVFAVTPQPSLVVRCVIVVGVVGLALNYRSLRRQYAADGSRPRTQGRDDEDGA